MTSTVSEGERALNGTVLEVLNVEPEHRLQGRVGGDLVAQVHVATADVCLAKAFKISMKIVEDLLQL